MARKRKSTKSNNSTQKTSSTRARAAPIPKECNFCHDLIVKRLADHERICKFNSIARRQAAEYRLRQRLRDSNAVNTPNATAGSSHSPTDDSDLPPQLSALFSRESLPMDVDPPPPPETGDMQLPGRFIYVKHHPHSGKPNEIIPLDSTGSLDQQHKLAPKPAPGERPWAPFKCLADATFAYRCVSRRMANKDVDADLAHLRTEWADGPRVTFANHREMERSLDAAREGNVRFHKTQVSIDFEGRELGGTYSVEIQFRDPWDVMKRWLRDETLVGVSTWFSQQRYLCLDGKVDLSNPLYDEPYTGTTWGAVDDSLPANDKYPACYVPAHIWLDKGLVSTKVKMHPFLLRGCWIHSATRNGSGNGGAALLGFVVMPAALREIDPKTLKGGRRTEYDTLKRKIYHKLCGVVMASLEARSRNGEALRFGDGVTRVAHPGILIESMDFEEVAAWLAIRNSRSLHPCPKCLVHHNDLHKLFECSVRRTPELMKDVLRRAARLKATEREELLKSYGLHNFKLFLWKFKHSDPYAATCYDLLHYFDGGKWGRHVWVLIKEYLQSEGLASKFNDYMNRFPRWRDLKHFPSPTTIDYAEGQAFVDILKCALPCLVQLLPSNSELVRIVRTMQKLRTMLGLEVTTGTRLDHVKDLVREYKLGSDEVSDNHGKDFNFLKQHSLSHSIDDFMSKGTSRNMNTRVGEGFQQEVEKMYQKTNGKNAERQIGLQDEREEAMARVQMAIDAWQRAQQDNDLEASERTVIPVASETSLHHWRLGAPMPRISARRLEAERKMDVAFRNFDMRLREYIAQYHPAHQVRLEQQIQIQQCKVLYVDYQSKVDWRGARDILRCSSLFHGLPRFDSVIYEDDNDPLALGQLHFVFRCHLPGDVALDLAIIQPFRTTAWQPKTRTDCPVRQKLTLKNSHFIALEHVVRGTLLCPIFGGKDGMHYIIDCVDEDMYLRLNNID